jgi:hypothetical protein
LFGSLVGVGDGDDVGDLLAFGDEEQAFAVDLADGGPADGEDFVVFAAADGARVARRAERITLACASG